MSNVLNVKVRFEEGSYWATVDEFPGVFAAGHDLEELRQSLEEGISLYIADDTLNPPKVTLSQFRAAPVEVDATAELVYA